MARKKNELFDWVKALLIAIVLVFIVRMFLFSPIVVDGPSMQPTLHDRDQMIVNKFIYRMKDPDRFDIVIFHATSQKDFIKRVIGLPGENIIMKDNQLYIDGKEVEEPFLLELPDGMTSPEIWKNDFELEELPEGSPEGYKTVPDGYVLVLGDNRNNSTDSRSLGLIPIDEIVGKANIIYWPLNRVQILKE